MGKYDEITKARQVLELHEFASLKEIKNKYQELLKEWHPDLYSGIGGPNGSRTRVLALRGPRPRPLDDGTIKKHLIGISEQWTEKNNYTSKTIHCLLLLFLAGERGFEPL
jgi:hypothetical protein